MEMEIGAVLCTIWRGKDFTYSVMSHSTLVVMLHQSNACCVFVSKTCLSIINVCVSACARDQLNWTQRTQIDWSSRIWTWDLWFHFNESPAWLLLSLPLCILGCLWVDNYWHGVVGLHSLGLEPLYLQLQPVRNGDKFCVHDSKFPLYNIHMCNFPPCLPSSISTSYKSNSRVHMGMESLWFHCLTSVACIYGTCGWNAA